MDYIIHWSIQRVYVYQKIKVYLDSMELLNSKNKRGLNFLTEQ